MANDQDPIVPDPGGSSSQLEELVAQCVLRVQEEGAGGLRAFLADHPDSAAEIERRMAWLSAMGLVSLPTGSGIEPDPDSSGVYRQLRTQQGESSPVQQADRFGHYRVIKELGRGGQAVVYHAEDTRLSRQVALKVMTGIGDLDDAALARFRREAEVASRLDDSGICTVYESGAFDKTAYIAMRLVDGETLAERIGRARDDERDGPASLFFDLEDEDEVTTAEPEVTTAPDRVDVARTIAVIEQVAGALHTAHEAGVTHRDIKPGNIMVTGGGDPVVLDFGLAGDTESDQQTLTREGDYFGTPAYMAPEQLAANRIKVDRRADVYSLGVVLYECLTLERPFQTPTREALYQAILTEEPPSPRGLNPAISADLEVVIATAMDKNRDRRYQTAEDLAEELRRVREHEPIRARPASTVTRVLRWTQRHPARATAALAAVFTLAVSAALVTWSLGETERATLSEAATRAEKKARELERARAEEAEAEREALLADERERNFQTRLLSLATGEHQQTGAGFSDPSASARAQAGLYFDAFRDFGVPLMAADGPPAVIQRLQHAGEDKPRLAELMQRALYDAALVLIQGGASHAAALRDQRPLPNLSPQQRRISRALPETAPQSVLRWDRLTELLARDPNPWRRQIWAEIVSANEENRPPDLGRLTSDEQLGEQTGSSLVWLANALLSGADVVRITDEATRIERVIDAALSKQSDDEATIYSAWCTKGSLEYLNAIGLSGAPKRDGLSGALRAFEVARDLSPHSAGPYSWLARINAALGKGDTARTAFERALELSPENAAMARVSYADGLFHGGDHAAALEVFRDLAEDQPDVGLFQRLLGDALLYTGSSQEAAAAYRRALQLDPTLANAYATLSNMMLMAGELEDAFELLDRGLQARPAQRQIRNMMAFTLTRLRDRERADAVFNKLCLRLPQSAEPYLLKGQVLAMSGADKEALTAFQQGLKIEGRSRESWVAVAQQHLTLNNHPQAQATCRDGLAIWPDDVDLYRLLALSLWQDSEPGESVTAGVSAIELGATGFSINLAVGGGLVATGAFEEAIPYLEAAEAADSSGRGGKLSWCMSLLWAAQVATGDVDGARQVARRWMEAEPGPGAKRVQGILDGLDKDYDVAINELRASLSTDPPPRPRRRARVEDILAIQPVVRGVAEPSTALDYLRLARAAAHRWEFAHAAAAFEEGYRRARTDPSVQSDRVRLAEGALSAARAAAMVGRGLGREHVPPLTIRNAEGAPIRNASNEARFVDSRPGALLIDLLDDDDKSAANDRAFSLLQTCLDEALAGLSATDDEAQVDRLRHVLQTILDDPFLVIFRHPPEGTSWAERATAFMERVHSQLDRYQDR